MQLIYKRLLIRFFIRVLTVKMNLTQNKFPHDNDNRIQKLYNDVNINTIFSKNKIQNTKKVY